MKRDEIKEHPLVDIIRGPLRSILNRKALRGGCRRLEVGEPGDEMDASEDVVRIYEVQSVVRGKVGEGDPTERELVVGFVKVVPTNPHEIDSMRREVSGTVRKNPNV
jgi:hypothetical protein